MKKPNSLIQIMSSEFFGQNPRNPRSKKFLNTRHSITFFFRFGRSRWKLIIALRKKNLARDFRFFWRPRKLIIGKRKKKLFPKKDFHLFRSRRKLIIPKRKKNYLCLGSAGGEVGPTNLSGIELSSGIPPSEFTFIP